jgi:hypothetical protein
LAKVLIAPRWSKTRENTGRRTDLRRIPTDAETIAVERFCPLFGVKALQDKRIGSTAFCSLLFMIVDCLTMDGLA